MLAYVLGAPGSGKTALVPHLRAALDHFVVLDWDFQLDRVGTIAGTNLRTAPKYWHLYDDLLLATACAVIDSSVDCVVLGVRSPTELAGWPVDAWVLLDCPDDVRLDRLSKAGRSVDAETSIADASRYRQLGLLTVDSAVGTLGDVADRIASTIGMLESRNREI